MRLLPLLLAAGLSVPAGCLAGPAGGGLQLLDVPFVPQGPALCGGATVAMVMRFWGAPGVHAEDFASLVDPNDAGIPARSLERTVRERGWQALSFGGGLPEAQAQLRRGRPVVALLRERAGRNHYVVLVGAGGDRVVLHDPARGPFRVVDARELQRKWSAAGNWSLLILPPCSTEEVPAPSATAGDEPAAGSNRDSLPAGVDGRSFLLDRAVRLARQGDLETAGELLETASALLPGDAAPLRELAGVRFRQQRWKEAEALAARAARLQPQDAFTWQLLATTRFVRGDAAQALTAWNQVQEPQVDLTRIDGLARTRYDIVAEQLDQPPGTLLTAASLRRAHRRLASLPSQQVSHIEYQPLPGGIAQVNVNVLERPRWSPAPRSLPGAVLHSVVERTLRIESAAPTGNGELWSASWRWWENRPALEARLDLPAAWSPLGIWRVEASWERQSYRRRDLQQIVTSERHRTALGCGQWATADWHWDLTGALERWSDRGQDVALEFGLEWRAANDRLSLRGEAARAWNTSGSAPYSTGSLLASWCSSSGSARRSVRLLCRAGTATATSSTPLLLWPAAGTGEGGPYLLRAHPLLDEGVLGGPGLARELTHGGIEVHWWPRPAKLVSLGVATFVDVALPGAPFANSAAPPLVDVGTGLRVRLPGQTEILRMDLARGIRDGRMAFSIGFETDRFLRP